MLSLAKLMTPWDGRVNGVHDYYRGDQLSDATSI